MFDSFISPVVSLLQKGLPWLAHRIRPPLAVEVLSFWVPQHNGPDDSLGIITPYPWAYCASLWLTNRSSRTVYLKDISVTICGQTYPHVERQREFLSAGEEKRLEVTFPAPRGQLTQTGRYEIQATPTKGRATRVAGDFPVDERNPRSEAHKGR